MYNYESRNAQINVVPGSAGLIMGQLELKKEHD